MKTGLSQAELAGLVGLDVRAYASYEYARSRLNYPAARKLLSFFWQLNPQWLAEGEGPMLQGREFKLPESESLETGPRAPFSAVFKENIKGPFLKSPVLRLLHSGLPVRLFGFRPDVHGRLAAKERLGDVVSHWLAEIPDDSVEVFMDKLFRRLAALYARSPRDSNRASVDQRREEIERIEKRRRMGNLDALEKEDLTESESGEINENVKSPLANLLKRLNERTSEPGKKSELADYLGAPLASVSRWLSGDREPGGEVALKMLYWVERQERK